MLVHSLFNQDYPSVDIYHEREEREGKKERGRERAKDFNGNVTTSHVIAKKNERIVDFFSFQRTYCGFATLVGPFGA